MSNKNKQLDIRDAELNIKLMIYAVSAGRKEPATVIVSVPDSECNLSMKDAKEVHKFLEAAINAAEEKKEYRIPDDQLFTSHEAAGLLQVDPSSIVKWVSDGKLPAFRTPGKHRRVRAGDLRAFILSYQMHMPHPLSERRA